ncbi:MAG: dTMP kinase [Terrimicrobiaceae bacterium]|jgi:dTMP kinase
MSRQGIFISFEGSEGCGKTTQIRLLSAALRESGAKVILVREPGGTESGEIIRHLLQHAPEGAALTAEAELLLFAASRAQLVREVIQPALAEGHTVISDRFLDSTTVYQGVARKISAEATRLINGFAVGLCLPDATFLLDLDRAAALARMEDRARDRIERESEEFFEAVRRGYLDLAKRESGRIHVLDAARPPDEIAEEIRQTLKNSNLIA